MAMGVQVLVTDPAELEKIRQRESDITRERIQKILDAGANVILTTKGIDDMCLKYFVEAGAIACRRVARDDMRRIVRMTGATIVSTLADDEGNESFDSECLGSAEEVYEDSISDNDMILIRAHSTAEARAATVLLRGANDYLLDEVDRSLHDAFCIVKRVLESGKVVPGGGAVECALSVHLENYATTLESREQLAIAEFADALLVIPKTLAVNAAKDAIELVAKLRAYHHAAQEAGQGKEHLADYGLDLINGVVRNNVEAGVLEPMLSKVKMIQFATEAAITILRIDDLIRLDEDEEPQE
jgi:T-complex protein 1 subunit alpha